MVIHVDLVDGVAEFNSTDLLGILPTSDGEVSAALRLRPGEDESCLWMLKCDDAELGKIIRRSLQTE